MGSWSAGVWGNDTAEDLKSEYQCAFYRYDPEEAVRRLDEYVRTSVGDESDTIEWCKWCNYIYRYETPTSALTKEITAAMDRDIELFTAGEIDIDRDLLCYMLYNAYGLVYTIIKGGGS